MDILLHQKKKKPQFLTQVVFEILKFKKFWNLIGREHFRL